MTAPVTTCRLTVADRPAGRIALLTLDDDSGPRRPCTISAVTIDTLDAALERIEADGDLVGVMLTGKPGSFCAGADLDQFVGLGRDGALAAARRGHEVFARLGALSVPTLAAINGACMGGGLELALHCDARTVSTSARAIGFPEVALSIVPGWGGTQLSPALVGARDAVRAIVMDPLARNRTMLPADALARGFADRLVDAACFVDDSLALLERLISGDEHLDRDVDPADGLDEALAAGRAEADARTHGATPAPYVALELIEHAARGGDLADGRRREQDALAELVASRHGQAAIYSFGLTSRRAKRQTGRPDAPARDVRRVGIVGAGLMGAQLGALHVARLQVPVVMVDVDEEVLARCRATIDGQLARLVERGRLDEGRARFVGGLVATSTDLADLAGADWVMEAVAEDLALKQRLLAEVERHVDDDAVIATNTSSLSVRAMAAGLRHPERVVGLHFFNPVAVLPLVEVVRPEGAHDSALATAFEVAVRLSKTTVACADAPGFVVNRLLFRFHLAAAAAIADGTALADVDAAIRRLGLPMGPFELFGLVGLGVVLHVSESLVDALGDRFAVDDNLRTICTSGLDGVFDDDGEVHPELLERLEVVAGTEAWDREHIQWAALVAVADEVGRMLDEQVVDDPRDIDTAMLLGAGWPAFNGGLCHWLDHTGLAEEVLGRRLL